LSQLTLRCTIGHDHASGCRRHVKTDPLAAAEI
jgi:hypothetical protein